MTEKPTSTKGRTLDAPFIAESAEVAPAARIGARTRIWHHTQVDPDVRVGEDCVLGKGVHVASAAVIGNRVKIQDGCGVFGATLSEAGQDEPAGEPLGSVDYHSVPWRIIEPFPT